MSFREMADVYIAKNVPLVTTQINNIFIRIQSKLHFYGGSKLVQLQQKPLLGWWCNCSRFFFLLLVE